MALVYVVEEEIKIAEILSDYLTPVEFRLLHSMMIRPSRIFSREVLMQTCYTDDRIINDRTIDSHMRNLRKKLNCSGEVIHTIYGVGYKVE
ncbi:winged helix-turn-helix domain-containing protein [Vibrio furnissii]|uniref:winged helix-turn-helix domain-containing protein n=1 Tax=Vibrio furnissii TaxID=29494 RepID=UPI003751D297